jgi:hypothetical protein
MAGTGTVSPALAELTEFARFTWEEQRYIERALDLALGEPDLRDGLGEHLATLRERHAAYRELRALRFAIPQPGCPSALDGFMGMLLRATAQDLVRGSLASFGAYRFLYERLMGAAIRPWLPAAFCGAAALPQIHPDRRKALLSTLTEAAATAPAWSHAEPTFLPRTLAQETD